ncbi:hypothetical protein [Micromonospora sp. NPDC049679]|uniref:hypothetical protein n=1 Tax=Micromonospora sp. NPDC049679 TaxID=3155920 RepID=UPI0033EFE273
MTIIPETRPVVRAAIVALDALGATTPRQAAVLLGMWPRHRELTQADIDLILFHYRDPGAATVVAPQPRADDPTGLLYERDPGEPQAGRSLPPYAHGVSISGRQLAERSPR